MKKRWGRSIIEQAKDLRRKGYTFGQLTRELGVSKSTLHSWIRGIQRPREFTALDRIRWAKEIQPLGAQMNKRKKEERLLKIADEVKNEILQLNLNTEIKRAILASLYWCEGSKVQGSMVFVNTDPRLMVLFLTLLRECYPIDESRLRLRLHLHDYHQEQEVKSFWATLLGIPVNQFEKTYRKARSKEKTFRRNFGGICFLKYNSTELKERIVQYAFSLGEKVNGPIRGPLVEKAPIV